MNSPLEDRLRDALAGAGATIDATTLEPLRAPGRRRFRVDYRLVTAFVAVVLAGTATAVGLSGGLGGEDRAVATDPRPSGEGNLEMAVYLCNEPASKEASSLRPPGRPSSCQGRGATPEEIKAVERELRGLPGVEEISFVDPAAAYDHFRREYADNQALLDEVKITGLPAAFRVKIKEAADQPRVTRTVVKLPNVLSVELLPSPDEMARTQEPLLTVFLCQEGTLLPSCGAKIEHGDNGASKIIAAGKGATAAQKEAIRKIAEMPEVKSYVFESQEEAYRKFRRTSRSNEALVEVVRVEDMPESFRLTMRPGADWTKVLDRMKRRPGVRQALYQPCVAAQGLLRAKYGLSLPEGKVCAAGR